MSRSLVLAILSVCAVCAKAAGAETNKPTCAVLPFDARGGVTKDEAAMLTDRFASELDKTGACKLTSNETRRKVLEEQKFSRSDNCSASDCAIEAGRLLGSQLMAYGSVGKVGDTYVISAYLVNVENGVTERTASEQVSGKIDEVWKRGMAIVARRLAPADDEGSGAGMASTFPAPTNANVVVVSNPSSGTLDIGGRRITLSGDSKVYLTQGRHPFALDIPGQTVRIYGVFTVYIVDHDTRLAQIGARDKGLFQEKHIRGALEGRPARWKLSKPGVRGPEPVLMYELSLNPLE